ncbi:MAG: PBP1A family penicillin-binding protein [Candidatus Uhrbacteria bacterium]|nr:PBP1A family penicillin-binding protein [Patescibacteria group bacterium]MBU1907453.1 PBP1A family penicillin-binding protein [Patescibacteria group bacterium]
MAYQYKDVGPSWRRHKINNKKRGKIKLPGFLKKIDKKMLTKNAALIIIAAVVLGSIFMLGVFAWATKDLPDPDELIVREVAQSTKIFDQSGEHLLYEIHGNENRTLVQLDELPQYLIDATISVEDQQFYKHGGFNPVRIFKGVVFGTLFKGRAEGGSTLTQQFVKNAVLTDERKISRKIKELVLSIEIERRFSKDQILQMYFNEIPYGSTNYGVESAAQSYFGKTVSEINLAEAATLAALPKAPSRYLNNPDLLDERRDLILQMMVSEGYIEQDDADLAQKQNVVINERLSNIDAPHFVLWIKEQLEEEYGERLVEQGGLKVTTTLDWDKQQAAEEAVTSKVEENGERYGFTNAALVAINPHNGQILAMVGSKDYFDDDIDGQVNVALRDRQPGSSFKPIVYTAAFEKGYTPNTVLWDVKTDFPSTTGTYSPNNYDLNERGPVTIRTALQGSLNIPAVKATYLVGVENAINFAEALGYSTFGDRSRFGLSIVLGGAEVKLLEHVNAYAVFASEGTYHEPVAILKVEDSEGQTLFEWEESKGKKVMDENYARMITDVLSDNAARAYVFGGSNNLQLGSRPVAAKTGTTNDYRDGWTIGYTPSLAAGVWGGNNDNSEMARGAGGSTVAAPIWNAFMKAALADEGIEYFAEPEIPITGKAVLDGALAETTVTIDKATQKLATDYTPASYREEVTFAEYHNILYYVDRADPLGEAPGAESKDPQYQSWENGVVKWLTAKSEETGIEIVQGTAPTETDDVHVPENIPKVEIVNPSSGQHFDTRDLELDVEAGAARGISRIEYYLDGFYLTTSYRSDGHAMTTIPNTIDRGQHTLRAIAYDDVDNSAIHEININIDSDPAASKFDFHSPQNNEQIDPVAATYSVVLELSDPSQYEFVTLYYGAFGTYPAEVIGTVESPSSPFITLDWTLPGTGNYALRARADAVGDGTDLSSPTILVHVGQAAEQPTEEPVTEEPTEPGEYDPDALNPFAQ